MHQEFALLVIIHYYAIPSFFSHVFCTCSRIVFNGLTLNCGCSITVFIRTNSILIAFPFNRLLISCFFDFSSLSCEIISSREELRDSRFGMFFFFFGRLRFVEVLWTISRMYERFLGRHHVWLCAFHPSFVVEEREPWTL